MICPWTSGALSRSSRARLVFPSCGGGRQRPVAVNHPVLAAVAAAMGQCLQLATWFKSLSTGSPLPKRSATHDCHYTRLDITLLADSSSTSSRFTNVRSAGSPLTTRSGITNSNSRDVSTSRPIRATDGQYTNAVNSTHAPKNNRLASSMVPSSSENRDSASSYNSMAVALKDSNRNGSSAITRVWITTNASKLASVAPSGKSTSTA
mmetsp:Transcript_27948/g.90215  ORF Transcript_27948/g.90215 Transcript_27948/m.90215 type:complete len:207 (+) Transcript_27948:2487-3107(+)